MLKKVIIICIAFSFVFIGGIAFATDKESGTAEEGKATIQELVHSSGDVAPPPAPDALITEDDEDDEPQEQKKAEEGDDGKN